MSFNFANEPQPRTIGASREDVLSNLMYFFGSPSSPEKLNDYSEHRAPLRKHLTHQDPKVADTPRPVSADAMTYHFPGATLASGQLKNLCTHALADPNPHTRNCVAQMPTPAQTQR